MDAQTGSLDQDRLQRIIAEIQEEIPRAGHKARLLQTAVGLLNKAAPPPAQPPPPSKWPPLPMTIAMLDSAPDTTVGELLGLSRNAVQLRRARLGIAPFERGGSVQQRREAREAWMQKWRPRLVEAGLLPDERHQTG